MALGTGEVRIGITSLIIVLNGARKESLVSMQRELSIEWLLDRFKDHTWKAWRFEATKGF